MIESPVYCYCIQQEYFNNCVARAYEIYFQIEDKKCLLGNGFNFLWALRLS